MPEIRPSSDLRNKYNEISKFCHEHNEPVYITKNGKGDLAVMSIKTYEKLVGKYELHELLNQGIDAANDNKVKPFRDVIDNVQKRLTE